MDDQAIRRLVMAFGAAMHAWETTCEARDEKLGDDADDEARAGVERENAADLTRIFEQYCAKPFAPERAGTYQMPPAYGTDDEIVEVEAVAKTKVRVTVQSRTGMKFRYRFVITGGKIESKQRFSSASNKWVADTL